MLDQSQAPAPFEGDAGDMLQAPAYWALLSLAFVHAAWRLVLDPFAWDKTPHRREAAPEAEAARGVDRESVVEG